MYYRNLLYSKIEQQKGILHFFKLFRNKFTAEKDYNAKKTRSAVCEMRGERDVGLGRRRQTPL